MMQRRWIMMGLLPAVLASACRLGENEKRPAPDVKVVLPAWLLDLPVFVYGRPPVEYLEQVKANGIAWSVYHGGFNEDEHAYVKDLQGRGVHVASNFATMQGSLSVTGDMEFAERTACAGIDGKKAQALWIQPDPPYLPCNNNSEWKRFLEERICEHAAGEVDAIQFDEIEGIAGHLYIAGFCDYCMSAFRDYLARKFGSKELKNKLGIDDLESFNYREYLSSRSISRLSDDPNSDLRKEFVLFQLESRREEIRQLTEKARGCTEREIAFTGNTFYFSVNKQFLADLLDFYVFENQLAKPPDGKYIGTHLLARAMQGEKPAVMFPTIVELGQMAESGKDWELIPLRIAEAGSVGQGFLLPYKAYVFGGGGQTVTGEATAPAELVAPYTGFLRGHEGELKDAKLIAGVGVLYRFRSAIEDYIEETYATPWTAGERTHECFLSAARMLQEAHIPFDVVYAGEDGLAGRTLRIEALAGLDAVLLPSDLDLDANETAVLRRFEKGGGKIVVAANNSCRYHKSPQDSEREAFISELWAAGVKQRVSSELPPDVSLVLSQAEDGVFIHLLNYSYDQEAHVFKDHENLDVAIDLEMEASEARWFAPELDAEGEPIDLEIEGGSIRFQVPSLHVYGIARIR